MYKYKHSVYVDKKMWWINTDFQQQTIIYMKIEPFQKILLSSSKSQNVPAISILIKVSHFYTKTHEKTLCNLIFSYLSHKIIYFYIGKFYPKKYWIFAINLLKMKRII